MIDLQIYTVPDEPEVGDPDAEDEDEDPDDPSPPVWTALHDLSKDGALPRAVWDRFDDMIDEKCKAEDLERRREHGL